MFNRCRGNGAGVGRSGQPSGECLDRCLRFYGWRYGAGRWGLPGPGIGAQWARNLGDLPPTKAGYG